ncbi:MAG: glutamine-hydrolyzing GMP synthase [Bacteroidales bacterium OttesenSCG-928-I14]|jgi:GMP synthase (glutamine-hydrolysing)|nr:glutamine-hydrolyzing GMP synthase [Bacteroidales bacterium OttesenSCG-928-I14]
MEKDLESIIVLDFGSQTTQLICRRVRELNVYCEIFPYDKFPKEKKFIIGVILSGGPFSVNDTDAFKSDLSFIRGKYPLLGICYGAQYLVYMSGGKVERSGIREYGRAILTSVKKMDPLMKNISNCSQVWMSHGDTIVSLPKYFIPIANTEDVKYAAYRIESEKTWGVQFHPEVSHTEDGMRLLDNFLTICNARRNWTSKNFIDSTIDQLRMNLGNDKVISAVSGGVDSSVCAVLLNKAIGKNLICIFVDNGLLRKGEFLKVLKDYESFGLNVYGVDAQNFFYKKLAGVKEPEKKRKIIGGGFIDIFEQEARKIKGIQWLAQGTIYPDVIESLSIRGVIIKSHHNVGGLPNKMNFKLIEPLRLLFKDEVRRIGYELGMKKCFIERHPFPGPGLGVRIIGEITPERVHTLQEADDIFISGLREWNLYNKFWQAGVVLLPVKSIGVMGDERTYEDTIALRVVTSVDAMTADWARLPYDFLAKMSNEIINKVKKVNRVVYDISSKPPSTIEWE